jgi:hypothetical protein
VLVLIEVWGLVNGFPPLADFPRVCHANNMVLEITIFTVQTEGATRT